MTPLTPEQKRALADKIESATVTINNGNRAFLTAAERAAIADALCDAADDGWRDIASAPLRTAVLVCNPKIGPLPIVAKRYASSWIAAHGNGRMLQDDPTHWRPLPAPPKGGEHEAQ
jgi:hypothetical protein